MWWASTQGGDRPVVVLTRDPLADRMGAVVAAACTRQVRGLLSEVAIGVHDGMPEACVVCLDNLHTIRRGNFRRRIASLDDDRMAEICDALDVALGCQ